MREGGRVPAIRPCLGLGDGGLHGKGSGVADFPGERETCGFGLGFGLGCGPHQRYHIHTTRLVGAEFLRRQGIAHRRIPARRPNKTEKPAAERIDAEAHFVKRKAAIVGGDTDIRSEHQFEPRIETLAVDDGDEWLATFGAGSAERIDLVVLEGLLPAAQAGSTSGTSTPSEKSSPFAVSRVQRISGSASSAVNN
jgi:hypothetical protein